MRPKFFCYKIISEQNLDNLSLKELENRVDEITKKQNYISNCKLSEEVTALAVKELQEQKKELLEAMHRKIDTLYGGIEMYKTEKKVIEDMIVSES